MSFIKIEKMPLTSVSSVWSRGTLCLNLPIQTAGQFVYDGIFLIPPHTQNIRDNGIGGVIVVISKSNR